MLKNKKLIAFIYFAFFAVSFLGANTSLDEAFGSFGIEGGAEKNRVLYSSLKDEESGKNAAKFLMDSVKKNKENYLIAKRVLEEKGVPESFIWIAMTETKFNNSVALRRTKTAGIWQMVPFTSRMFGLKVGKGVDERKDVEKCTAAFADYCHYMHKRFKRWDLVMVGYNCGDERLKRVIKKTGSTDLNVLLDPKKKHLSKETRAYFKRVITHTRTANLDNVKEFLETLEQKDES